MQNDLIKKSIPLHPVFRLKCETCTGPKLINEHVPSKIGMFIQA